MLQKKLISLITSVKCRLVRYPKGTSFGRTARMERDNKLGLDRVPGRSAITLTTVRELTAQALRRELTAQALRRELLRASTRYA